MFVTTRFIVTPQQDKMLSFSVRLFCTCPLQLQLMIQRMQFLSDRRPLTPPGATRYHPPSPPPRPSQARVKSGRRKSGEAFYRKTFSALIPLNTPCKVSIGTALKARSKLLLFRSLVFHSHGTPEASPVRTCVRG